MKKKEFNNKKFRKFIRRNFNVEEIYFVDFERGEILGANYTHEWHIQFLNQDLSEFQASEKKLYDPVEATVYTWSSWTKGYNPAPAKK